jgi:S-DNA-T family DNA segregation ATPase FtsK/SpoIIIE
MAARKKNTGSRRRSSAANGSRSTKSRNQTTVRSKKPAATVKTRTEPAASGTGVGRDIILVLILLCSVILFICVLGFGGRFGKGISYGLFGLFGKMAYVFPLALFGGTAFYIANKKNGMITVKKNTRKGTYKMKVTVKTKASKLYRSVSGSAIVTIRVR